MLVQGIGQLLARPLSTKRLPAAALFLCLSVILLSLGPGHTRFSDMALYFYGVHVPTYFLLPPLILGYFQTVTGDESAAEPQLLRFPGYLWSIPFWLSALILLPSFFFPPELKQAFIEKRIADPYLFAYRLALDGLAVAGVVLIAYVCVRLFFQLRIIELLQTGDHPPVLWHFRVLVFWVALAMGVGLAAQYLNTVVVKRMTVGVVSVGLLWMYLLDFRFPRFFHRLDQEIRDHTERYSKSRLERLDTEALVRRLERVMRDERLYVDEDLSREKLAAAMDLHPAQLSELLNAHMDVDLRTYINQYRVAAAKHMLLEEPDRAILSIGYAAGFNSRASFNRYFKAIVGQTPAAFRATKKEPA